MNDAWSNGRGVVVADRWRWTGPLILIQVARNQATFLMLRLSGIFLMRRLEPWRHGDGDRHLGGVRLDIFFIVDQPGGHAATLTIRRLGCTYHQISDIGITLATGHLRRFSLIVRRQNEG